MRGEILVVDDILANRRLMQAKLEASYYSVSLASNGEQAIKMATEQLPEIILLDVMMPGMDGYEVCQILKNNDRTRHIPIVMLTALSDVEDKVRGLEAGADDFLSKPVDDFALMARLEALERYNTVIKELRQRELASHQGAVLTREETAELIIPANILVIDSNKKVAGRLARDLSRDGHLATSWHDCEGDNPFSGKLDVAILGLSEQDHDPLRLCAHLNSMPEIANISIVVTYNPADRELASKSLQLGAGDMVTCPVSSQELLARVKTQLKRTRYIEILRRRVDRGLELSLIDQLTGLYNRRYMLSYLDQWTMRSDHDGKPTSVVAFDIDHFKPVNDQFGHEAGDIVLAQFAERIQQNVRPIDIVCRPGGEEFLVIMPETAGDLACVGAERIRHAIASEPFRLDRTGQSLDITVSAGVATFQGKGDSIADLLHRADQALYRAKQLGRNRTESLAA
ncbi:MAG: PleD family two-component system response regulator [Henriciella sp.]